MNAAISNDATVKGTLLSATDERIELAVPHSDYRLFLVPLVPAATLQPYIGKRIKGVIRAEALRIHATSPATGGGRFIEPVIGPPRIVAGRIRSVNKDANELIVDLGVAFIVTPLPEQDWTPLVEGQMVNFYVRSGATFTPESD